MGCAVGDYDNDGKPDLALSMDGRVLLFHNEGNRTFKDVTQESGIFTTGLALGLTFIDYDHDGDLDLYVTRFNDFPLDNPAQAFTFPTGRRAGGKCSVAQQWKRNIYGLDQRDRADGRCAISRSDRQRHQQRSSNRFCGDRLAKIAGASI